MLARLCGWNEPGQVKHDHVHLQVDSALIEQLRAGYAQLGAREKRALPVDGNQSDTAPAVPANIKRDPES